MVSSFAHFLFTILLVFSFQPSLQHLSCRRDEQLALLKFKESFVINKRASSDDPFAYPKVSLWKSQGMDCCTWEGIWCDQDTGHVIGLDLSGSCLLGSINSSSSLFHLIHLKHLNLAFNNFNHSMIPYAFANLTSLNYLNLSNSFFSGQIPSELLKLASLSILDLAPNCDPSDEGLLELKRPNLRSLIENLTSLEYLHLSCVKINSRIPSILVNMSSLRSIHLSNCELFGEFPKAIFQLPKLQVLNLSYNPGLTGNLPEFHSPSHLITLDVSSTNFSGKLPASIGMLSSLEYLDAGNCNFLGLLPPSLGNLTKLQTLYLSNNSLRGEKVPFFSNLTQLTSLSLSRNQFTFPEIPSSFAGLTHLQILRLSYNQIAGCFPSWITNMSQLTCLRFRGNKLRGSLPMSISKLKNIEEFDVDSNHFIGTVDIETFLEFKYLTYLDLSNNNFSLPIKTRNSTNTISTKLKALGLGSCNLKQFPSFLHYQNQLEILDLSSNNIAGRIPKWIWELSKNLWFLDLSRNSLTNFENFPISLLSPSLEFLDLSVNMLEAPLPIPPLSIIFFLVFENKFNGEIPLEFCNRTSLEVLDVSSNKLNGTIPQCIGNFGKSLSILNLGENSFEGPIPTTWEAGNNLKAIKLGKNNLQGKLPRSLANCRMLEFLDFGNNHIKDTFPSWLGTLLELKILLLRSNGLYGAINVSESDSLFPNLRIIDLSHNGFTGLLPTKYFKRWNAMEDFDEKNTTYWHAYGDYTLVNNHNFVNTFPYSMVITNKGNEMKYLKIFEMLSAIDLSCNRFEGEIPEVVGSLKGLRLLNLSNNILVGPIPPVLGNLTYLEALDLSQNKLTGSIPTQLTQLDFLGVFNVSHNQLTGHIPKGRHFDTFENNSFDGNSGLCGLPLSRKCDNTKASPPPSSVSEVNEDSRLVAELGWKVVALGYGCGFLLGVVIGNIVFARKREWLMRTFRIRLPRRRTKGSEGLNRIRRTR